MRYAFFLLLALAACAEAPVESPPHDPEADRLLASVTGDAWDAAWTTASARPLVFERPGGETLDTLPPNPLPAFLSDEPPFLDAAAREQYETRVLGDTTLAGQPATLVGARFIADSRRTQPIRSVRAAVTASGTLLWIDVQRESESVLFDEDSRLRAGLAVAEGAFVPGFAEVSTRTDVPASDARDLSTSWSLAR